LEEARPWRPGYEFNFPVVALLEDEHAGDLPPEHSFASVSADNVCWEVLKEEEDGPGLVIRVYDVAGSDQDAVTLNLPFEVAAAEEIDFLELETLGPVACSGNCITFPLGHHEIKAVRVFPKGAPS
jgi:alpha-mannosidase